MQAYHAALESIAKTIIKTGSCHRRFSPSSAQLLFCHLLEFVCDVIVMPRKYNGEDVDVAFHGIGKKLCTGLITASPGFLED